MTPDEAQRILTRTHRCGCQELWYMGPPMALRCGLHSNTIGPCDNAVPPDQLDEAREVLRLADNAETERRRRSDPVNTPMTHEQIEAHLDKHLAAAQAHAATAGLTSLCPIYTAVRPIIVALASIPFIPKRWRDGLGSFVAVLDVVCPSAV